MAMTTAMGRLLPASLGLTVPTPLRSMTWQSTERLDATGPEGAVGRAPTLGHR